MNQSDYFQMQRSEDARRWLNHPDRQKELKNDIQYRATIDKKLGHLPECSLTKCHTNCKKEKTK